MSPRLPLTIIISLLTTVLPTANGATTFLLPNGSECSESRQCQSGCCVWNPFANEVCDKDGWFRRCMDDDYTFQDVGTGSAEAVCGSAAVEEEASDASNATEAVIDPDTASIKVMTYNLYLILLASDGITSLDDRAKRITDWFATPEANQYDIIALQETWTNPIENRDGMVAAGYCHYAYDERGSTGSGLALYSKHPIVYHDFRGFQNACGGVDCVADKGVLYTKIAIPKENDDITGDTKEKTVHVFNTHTMFSVDNHDVRRRQYDVMRTFINEQIIDPSELVLLIGDFNEDKINTPKKYRTMLNLLNAGEFALDEGSGLYSYDPNNNSLIDPDSAGAGSTQRALDYILYDMSALEPGPDSVCQYIQAMDESGDLSDHYPMSCEVMEAVTSIVPLPAKAETSDGKKKYTSTVFLMLLCLSQVIMIRDLLG